MAKKHTNSFTDSDIVIQAAPTPEFPLEEADGVMEALEGSEGTASQTHAETSVVNGYVIEDKAIPRRSSNSGLNYPINKLEAGSTKSFVVPATADTVKGVTSSIRTFAYRNGYKTTLRPETNEAGTVSGVRVWRKA